jgi:hypothetical protein
MKTNSKKTIRVAVFGAGGLGKAAARIISMKKELSLSLICDSHSVLSSDLGLDAEALSNIEGNLSSYSNPKKNKAAKFSAIDCNDPIEYVAKNCCGKFDAAFLALPNMPNEFLPGVVSRFAKAKKSIVFVDALKRSTAIRQMFKLDTLVKKSKGVIITGCGATPGLLSAAAVLAAQSFIEVEKVDIFWGVGIANWDAYKSTIREDIAHMPGFSVERAKAMSDSEVEALLEKTNGLLQLKNMEHADDVLLKRVGAVEDESYVEVGGVMDTRHAKKPVSTTMTLTGITFDGKRSSHRFILGDETSMAANVVGTALGYMKRALWLKRQGIFGVFGSTEFMPMVVR